MNSRLVATLGWICLVSVSSVGVFAQAPPVEDGKKQGWVSLFDGKTLEGWTQRNGTATYRVEDGGIVGKTTEGSPNSFLCTDKQYGDFDLKFEVKVDDRLNSGVQIRSNTLGAYKGRVNGPQVEIEASGANGAEAGYIYGEAAGGWMTPEEELKPHKHFKDGEWNAYRILAVGANIKVWINDKMVSDLTHEEKFKTHPRGFIGLQVHGIRQGQGPYEAAWRGLMIRELDSGWINLYNSRDLTGWQTTGNWLPKEEGVLLIQPRPGEKGWQRFSDYLWSEEKYKDFILDLEYAYPKDGNSGVFFRVGDIKDPVNTGIEAQVLDCSEKKGKMSAHDHGGIISAVAPSKNVSKKPGQWNRMVIRCEGSHLEVTLNKEKIVDIQLDETDIADRPTEGYIGLQDHGEPNNVMFRNIWIMKL